jgi:hypothetical protein
MCQLQPITGSQIQGFFTEIRPKNPDAIDNKNYLLNSDDAKQQRKQLANIKDINDNSANTIIGLKHPVRDLNDAFLANFAHAVYNVESTADDKQKLQAIRKIVDKDFNSETDVSDVSAASAFIFSRRMYYGVDGNEWFVSNGAPIDVPATMTLDQANQFVENLKTRTQEHIDKGLHLATFFSQKRPTEDHNLHAQINNLNPIGHIENLLDVNAINYLNPDTMTNQTFRIIGERTWVDKNGRVTYLIIAKKGDNQFSLQSYKTPHSDSSNKPIFGDINFNEMRIYSPR